MQLDVEALRTYLAVLDHGGMTRAADHLMHSQSAVSWRIKRLEERVGRALLVRDGHSFRPTRDGRALIDDARRIVELHDRAVSRLRSSDLTGTVRVGANEEVSASRMAAVLGHFRCCHPGATVEFVVGSSEALTEKLAASLLDVAVLQIVADERQPTDIELWSDELRWVTCCENDFENGVVPLITYSEDCFYRPVSEPLLTASGISYNVAFSGGSSNAIVAAVEAGLGVAVLGSRFVGGDIVEWRRGANLGEMPNVLQVVRAAPGDAAEIVTTLLDAIASELSCDHHAR